MLGNEVLSAAPPERVWRLPAEPVARLVGNLVRVAAASA
jgi:hypothetical protein